MKWPFLAIVLLGLVAAICVAGLMTFLPAYLRGPTPTLKANEMQVVVAKRDIPAMQIVDGESIATKSVPRKEAPLDCFTDSVQVLGKVLALPMVAGQAFTKTCFAEGSGAHLAAAMPKGMRAVGIALSEHSGLFGVLYPGSRVDILVSYKAQAGEANSSILLQNVQFLGVEGHTIVSPDNDKSGRSDSGRKRMVTVMVDPDQARILEAAMEQGTLSLAMRNPLDTTLAKVAPEPSARPGPGLTTTAPAQQTWEITILRDRAPEVRKFAYVAPLQAR